MSFSELELLVIRWAEERKIIPRSNALSQAIKTLEEVTELVDALHRGDKAAARDAYGDVLVTMIIGADLFGTELIGCLGGAYEEIKDRKGTLREDGVFVKH